MERDYINWGECRQPVYDETASAEEFLRNLTSPLIRICKSEEQDKGKSLRK